MPQIEQLPDIFTSQLFWLAVVFGLIFFGIGWGMLPRIQSTVESRDSKIAEDLARAQEARAAADETEAAYRARIDASRADAARLAQEARQAAMRDTEAKVRKAGEKIAARTEAAEARIREAAAAARGEIEAVATEAAQQLVERLTGAKVEAKRAAEAVKAEFHV